MRQTFKYSNIFTITNTRNIAQLSNSFRHPRNNLSTAYTTGLHSHIYKSAQFLSISTTRPLSRISLAPMSTQPNFKVQHDPKKKCFFIEFENNEKALLEYNLTDGVMDMYHTESPNSQRGKGIAAIITEAALKHARDHKLRVVPSCTYISGTFLPKHPEYQHLVVKPSL